MWLTIALRFWREILIVALAGIIGTGYFYVKYLRADVKRLEWANVQYEQTVKDLQTSRDKMYASYDKRIIGKNETLERVMKICGIGTNQGNGGNDETQPDSGGDGDGIIIMLNGLFAKPHN